MPDPSDPLRLKFTFLIAAIGIGAVMIAFLLAVFLFQDADSPAETIVAILGPVTGVIGTLAGYVAGQTAGAAGKERAEDRADAAQQQLTAIATTNADLLASARERHPDLFPEPKSSQQKAE